VTCDHCGRPVPDTAYICATCVTATAKRLVEASQLAGEVWTTVSGQDVVREVVGVIPHQSGSVNLAAGTRWDVAAGELATTARHIGEQRGTLPPALGDLRGPGLAALLAWLAGQLDWLRYRQEARELIDGLDDAIVSLRRVVDRPTQLASLGVCGHDGCELQVRHRPGVTMAHCGCGCVWDVAERRAWLLGLAEDHLVTASFASAALGAWGVSVRPDVIRQWAHRGRLLPHGGLYRLGDVRQLAVEAQRNRQVTVAA